DLLFLGRAAVRGIETGVRCAVEGRAVAWDGRLAIWNPWYRLLADEPSPTDTANLDNAIDDAADLSRKPDSDQQNGQSEVEEAGEFRVYLGAAAGVGKTWAMLDEAQRRRRRGTDVVIGYVESHGRPLTDEAAAGLDLIPRKTVEYRGAH